jgi:hypothetical protein
VKAASSERHVLNCAVAPAIPAHGSVTFEMYAQIPAIAADGTGNAPFYWALDSRAAAPINTSFSINP